jgi:hypothetical protein
VYARASGDSGTLVVENAYRWVGRPSLGAFAIYVDGKWAGLAMLGDQLTVRLSPGQHTVRVRLWWYLSPTVTVTIAPAKTRRLSADILRQQMIVTRFVRMMFDPFHSLSLQEVPWA